MQYFAQTFVGEGTRKRADVVELARIGNMLNVIVIKTVATIKVILIKVFK